MKERIAVYLLIVCLIVSVIVLNGFLKPPMPLFDEPGVSVGIKVNGEYWVIPLAGWWGEDGGIWFDKIDPPVIMKSFSFRVHPFSPAKRAWIDRW